MNSAPATQWQTHGWYSALADKNHSWGRDGVGSLIPNTLTQGMLGYAFSCPDMIGGGEYANFTANSDNWTMNFSCVMHSAPPDADEHVFGAPWRVLPPKAAELCVQAAKLP